MWTIYKLLATTVVLCKHLIIRTVLWHLTVYSKMLKATTTIEATNPISKDGTFRCRGSCCHLCLSDVLLSTLPRGNGLSIILFTFRWLNAVHFHVIYRSWRFIRRLRAIATICTTIIRVRQLEDIFKGEADPKVAHNRDLATWATRIESSFSFTCWVLSNRRGGLEDQ